MRQHLIIGLTTLYLTLLQPACSRGSHLSLGGLGLLVGGALYLHGIFLGCYRLLCLYLPDEAQQPFDHLPSQE